MYSVLLMVSFLSPEIKEWRWTQFYAEDPRSLDWCEMAVPIMINLCLEQGAFQATK